MKRKLICAVGAILILMSLLLAGGCAGRGGEETVPESETAEIETEDQHGADGNILIGDLAKYTFVRKEILSEDTVSDVLRLYRSFTKLIPDMQIKTDFYKEGIALYSRSEYEILVGNTEREESVSFMADMRAEDYGYAVVGKKIVIGGPTEDATVRAIGLFISNVMLAAKADNPEDVFLAADAGVTVRAKYDVNKLTLGNVPIEKFRIVYPSSYGSLGKVIAERIADAVRESSGYILEVGTDRMTDPSEYEIIIGETNRGQGNAQNPGESEAVIHFDGKILRFWGTDREAVSHSIRTFLNTFVDKKADEIVAVQQGSQVIKYEATEMTAMSFNVLVSQRSSERDARVIKIVLDYLPDTVGFQEASPSWMTTLKNGLSGDYAWVGVGRDGGNNGEYNPIFYKKDKFTLIESGTRWLSDTPAVVSKYSESSLNRIYTYALLERKADGLRILVVNTHFDHTSAEARNKQAAVLKAYLEKNTKYPVILTGDFNTTEDSSAFNTVTSAGVVDSKRIALSSQSSATFTNFGSANKVIDFIFVDPVSTSVSSYRVCSEMIDGNWPSDHHPVLITYRISG